MCQDIHLEHLQCNLSWFHVFSCICIYVDYVAVKKWVGSSYYDFLTFIQFYTFHIFSSARRFTELHGVQGILTACETKSFKEIPMTSHDHSIWPSEWKNANLIRIYSQDLKASQVVSHFLNCRCMCDACDFMSVWKICRWWKVIRNACGLLHYAACWIRCSQMWLMELWNQQPITVDLLLTVAKSVNLSLETKLAMFFINFTHF